MDANADFSSRIARIHGLNPSISAMDKTQKIDKSDVSHAEFQAMSSAFLGEHYNQQKLKEVEEVQAVFRKKNAEYYRRFKEKKIDASEYVDLYNGLVRRTFSACEHILGAVDFVRLFGAKPDQLGALIDKAEFVRAQENSTPP